MIVKELITGLQAALDTGEISADTEVTANCYEIIGMSVEDDDGPFVELEVRPGTGN